MMFLRQNFKSKIAPPVCCHALIADLNDKLCYYKGINDLITVNYKALSPTLI